MAAAQSGPTQPESAVPPATQSANSPTPSAAHNQQKRHHRHRKEPSQSLPQTDGTVSDSVAIPLASPRSKKAPKQRHQSVAIGTPPKHNGNVGQINGHSQRPASLGGSMLLATPLKEQAYAGPTFQASPAPSSLPVPKFFSRSVPDGAAQSLAARMEGEKTPEKEDSSPEPDVVSPQPITGTGQKSPLELFFKADRVEKEMERSRSSTSLSPEMAVRQRPPATEPRKVQQSSRNVFLQELDGENGEMISPKTVSHTSRQPPRQKPTSSPNITDASSDGESEREAHTKALKELLFNNVNAPPQQNTTPPAQPRPHSNPRVPDAAFEMPSIQRSASGPSTPAPSAEQQNHYSLHYGNRNLSPLFKAARHDIPSRPSGLRQQESASDVTSTPNSTTGHPPPQVIDPNSFSRNYINQHIRASGSASLPQLLVTTGSTPNLSSSASVPSQHGVIQTGNGTTNSDASPRGSSSSRDLKGMEDDLRRMLNLDVLSN